ncbi:D-aminoacylase [Nonomuraea antimicrobica]|uniref:D-aminoacylase n=1 Tax=Nonomuraea antimicrobica TaxID=561173 RepID=A0ABP7BIL6_9ACTN
MPTFDLLLRGGFVLDGTGGPGRHADVGVLDGRIAAVLPATADATAAEVLDCAGLAVAPGFIDLHSHADLSITHSPAAESCLRQGVTTLVTGNCGISPFPTVPDAPGSQGGGASASGPWPDFGAFAAAVEASGPAVNIAALVGHGALRGAAVGAERRKATGEEVARMRRLLAEAVHQGVFGLSTGLVYAPGSFADAGEITALAAEARQHGLLYSTHMRDEGDRLIEAVEEALNTAESTGVRLQISHLKAMAPANHGKVREALRLIDAARAEGLDVACDVYPYTASSTWLTARLPDWAMDGGPQALLGRLRDPQARQAIAADLRARAGRTFRPEATVLATMPEGRYSRWTGETLQRLADAEGIDPAEAVLAVLEAHRADVVIVNHAMAQDDVDTVLCHPTSAVVSDGWTLDVSVGGYHHPRNFGAFARALALSRDRGLLRLPEVVRKMTALPAARLGLADRGVLTESARADLAVFDPERVADTATYAAPLSYATGVRHVVVNGRPVVRDSVVTGQRPGRVLRRVRTAASAAG